MYSPVMICTDNAGPATGDRKAPEMGNFPDSIPVLMDQRSRLQPVSCSLPASQPVVRWLVSGTTSAIRRRTGFRSVTLKAPPSAAAFCSTYQLNVRSSKFSVSLVRILRFATPSENQVIGRSAVTDEQSWGNKVIIRTEHALPTCPLLCLAHASLRLEKDAVVMDFVVCDDPRRKWRTGEVFFVCYSNSISIINHAAEIFFFVLRDKENSCNYESTDPVVTLPYCTSGEGKGHVAEEANEQIIASTSIFSGFLMLRCAEQQNCIGPPKSPIYCRKVHVGSFDESVGPSGLGEDYYYHHYCTISGPGRLLATLKCWTSGSRASCLPTLPKVELVCVTGGLSDSDAYAVSRLL
ncbi:hypothetical protein AXG93_496s1180 [Marchantia polymorpha subsp. ruderalis]|uniref:Uncharacterized protein n=1 Tax=Marchantia polymorpha subsp. ruderalis TaxID=1480154 RepID=A0A176VR93_MARPO|nr:hypothetical protein AXG93_496s1180 [Marchantia polymorpha subsp. ruderalis]